MSESAYKLGVAFLEKLGISSIGHTGDKNYLAHLVAVYNDLKRWGCNEDVCLAGLFHSIYGTERFKGFTLPLDERENVQATIGEYAEYLAYINCVMVRSSFDALLQNQEEPFALTNRLTNESITITKNEYEDLCHVHLCDWLEQVPRCCDWNYRRDHYKAQAERLGGIALESWKKVYANELSSNQ
jgi:hypothetical protein